MQKKRLFAGHCHAPLYAKIYLTMRLAVGIILVTCLQASAAGYAQETRLTLDLDKMPIVKVLKTIEKRTDYRFVYSSNLFPPGLLIDLHVKDAPVTDVLSRMLENTGLVYRNVDSDLHSVVPV